MADMASNFLTISGLNGKYEEFTVWHCYSRQVGYPLKPSGMQTRVVQTRVVQTGVALPARKRYGNLHDV